MSMSDRTENRRTATRFRNEVAALYSGQRWKDRVANMSDNQIYAIWMKQQRATEVVLEIIPPRLVEIPNPYEALEPEQLQLDI